ncbi:hypothetical protein [Ovoidimarina sediminis]|uniref:hypothetical protein n=1 Tax=Ovoidimarina sediminis TaxID=3079856 RepID=UPI00290C19E4|nr:hypothetical protein [Rhodophyticola sp. MJ-SS7]MDU8945547.1 hypothetical protein [Rhodophyticola sp. MJ-SS7]
MKKIVLNMLKKVRPYLQDEKVAETILMNQGKILEELYSTKKAGNLSDYEWRVFSQWGEDGIIQFLIREVEIQNKTFVEFGVEDFFESNCRYLLMSSDWQGFVIDGSGENMLRLKNSYFYWKHDLQSVAAFVDKENINELLSQSNFDRDLGILSIDIDGNDYHILKAINVFEPRIIISEFNPYFGTDRAISVPYDPGFYRTEKHHSNLYFGASIKAIEHVLSEKGYTLVGTGMTGNNAYFVRNDLITDKLSQLTRNTINFNGFCRESRDKDGKLNFLRGEDRLNEIKGLPVLNVLTGTEETL